MTIYLDFHFKVEISIWELFLVPNNFELHYFTEKSMECVSIWKIYEHLFSCVLFFFSILLFFLFVCYLHSSILHSFSIFFFLYSLFWCLFFPMWSFFEIIIPTKWLKSNIIASRHYSCSHSLNFVTNWSCVG